MPATKSPTSNTAKKTSANSNTPKTSRVKSASAKSAARTSAKPATSIPSAAAPMMPVLEMGTESVRQIWENGAEEVMKTREKMAEMSQESVQTLSRTADSTAKGVAEAVKLGQENVTAAVECSGIATEAYQEMTAELYAMANEIFSENVALSKELLSCRSANDFFEIQSKMLRAQVEAMVDRSVKLTDMWFRASAEAFEPVQERMADSVEKISKSMAA